MDPTASYLNIYFSIEKFLWDNLASTESSLLINKDEMGSRIKELLTAGHAILWQPYSILAGNTGTAKLYVGATYFQDPGNIKLLTLFDKVKALFDTNASIPVYQYTAGVAGNKINELAFVNRLQVWPMVSEPNGFKTMMLSVRMLFGQKVV